MALTQVKAEGIATGAVTTPKLEDDAVSNAKLTSSTNQANRAVGADTVQDDAIGVAALSATGTASNTTFLRGDNSWVTPTDTNTTYSVGDGGLTQNNFTDADHTKLDGIAAGATVGAALTGSTNNTVCTVTGANAIAGEANLTYDGTNLQLTTDANNEGIKITGGSYYPVFELDANRGAGNTLGKLVQKWNGTQVASIAFVSGSDGTNKDDAYMAFHTADAGTATERLRIDPNGHVGIGTSSPNVGGHSKSLSISSLVSAARSAVNIEGNTANCHACVEMRNNGTLVSGIYSRGTNRLQFGTGASGTVAVEVNDKNLEIADGDLVIGTAGHGIDFSATTSATGSGTSTTHQILDEYEEGTWTPSMTNGPTNTSTPVGRYTRIGDTVHAYFSFNWTGQSDGTAAHAAIPNLPFTSTNAGTSGNALAGFSLEYSTCSGTDIPRLWKASGNTTSHLYNQVGAALEGDHLDGKEFRGLLTYIAA